MESKSQEQGRDGTAKKEKHSDGIEMNRAVMEQRRIDQQGKGTE